jgi:hypothetical protein
MAGLQPKDTCDAKYGAAAVPLCLGALTGLLGRRAYFTACFV